MDKTKGTAAGARAVIYALIILALGLTVFINLLSNGVRIMPEKEQEPVIEKPIELTPPEDTSVSESDAVSETDEEEKEPEKIMPESIKLSVVSDYTVKGSTVQVNTQISPAEASAADLILIWESSDEKVASVDNNGNVTAVGKGTAAISVRTENGVSAYTLINVIPKAKVYISPSHQVWYKYPVGDTNEAKESRRISEYCAERLALAGIESIIAKNSVPVKDRPQKAKKAKAYTYVAIHTKNYNEEGARVAFNKNMTGSSRLTLCIKDRLALIVNTESKGYAVSGLDKNYKELDTKPLGIDSTVVEVQSHTKKENAQWIIDNSKEIGYTIAEGILEYYLTDID